MILDYNLVIILLQLRCNAIVTRLIIW